METGSPDADGKGRDWRHARQLPGPSCPICSAVERGICWFAERSRLVADPERPVLRFAARDDHLVIRLATQTFT